MSRTSAAVLVWLLTVLLVGAVVLQVDVTALRQTMLQMPAGLLVVGALASLFMAIPLTGECLFWALRGLGHPVPRRTSYKAIVGSMTINGVLPMGGGELGRSAWLHQVADVPLATAALATVGIRAVKLFWLLSAATCAAWWLTSTPAGLAPAVTAALVALVMGGMAVPFGGALPGIERLPSPVRRLMEHFAETTVRPAPLAIAALLALSIVTIEMTLFAVLLLGVGGPWSPVQILGSFSLATIAGKLPITAMGLGTREAVVMALFEGATLSHLLTASLVHTTLCQLLPTVVGAATTWPFLRDIAGSRT